MTVQHTPPDALLALGALAGYQVTSGTLDTAVYIGSIGGAVIAAGMMDGTWVARTVRWLCSLAAGLIFAPGVIEWQQIQTPGIAMACAGAVSFAAWGLLRVLQDEAPKLLRRKAQGVK